MSRIIRQIKYGAYNMAQRWQSESAYFGTNWSNAISTISYTIAALVSLGFVFSKITNVAGLARHQVTFIVLMQQLTFYVAMVFAMP